MMAFAAVIATLITVIFVGVVILSIIETKRMKDATKLTKGGKRDVRGRHVK